MIVLYSLSIIYLQSNILVTQKHITELELQIEELSSSIKIRKSNLRSDPNIKEIYQQAVALGMVDPKEAQIIYYNPREVDYMNDKIALVSCSGLSPLGLVVRAATVELALDNENIRTIYL